MALENTVDFLMKNNNLKKSIDVLKTGEQFVKITNGDIILILGITGSGKSTFTQFLTTDGRNLTTTEDQETNDLLISDNNQRISTETTISKTLFPELVIDDETRSYIYDCPGFSDTRSAATDIASTYFIKKLLDNAVRVKLIFLINYAAVRKGVDRLQFIGFLKHATTMIKDVEKYADSLALIVTKVDNTQYLGKNNTYVHVSDAKKKQNIIDFFAETKQTLEKYVTDDAYTIKQHEVFRKSIKFIDIIMTERNGDYFKLGLFNRPSRSGTINEDRRLQENKKVLRKLVFDDVKFIECNKNDFGYTISDKTLNKINDIVNEIDEEIFMNYKRLAQAVDKYLNEKIVKTSDFQEMLSQLQADSNVWNSMLKHLKRVKSPLHFLQIIINTLNQLNIEIDSSILEDILNQISYIEYLQLVAAKSFAISRYKWFAPLKWQSKQIQGWINWFHFLFEIDEIFSKYDIQKDIKNNKFINRWALRKTPQGYILLEENLEDFLKEIEDHTNKNYDYIENINVDSTKIEYLNLVLTTNSTPQNIKTTCSTDGTLTIAGRILLLSEIVKLIDKCSKIKQIEIYATQKIIIDQDADFKNYSVIIIAQNWDVIGSNNINLHNGKFLGISKKFTHDNLLSIDRSSNIVYLYELQKPITSSQDTQIKAKSIFDHIIPKVIENYKYYLRQNLTNKIKRSQILECLHDLERNISKLKEYDIHWFVLDLQKLEEQFFELQYYDKLIDFYKSLFDRITEYSNKYFATSTEEQQKTLIYLCTAIQSKLSFLKNNKETNLIINLHAYVQSVIENIEKLNDLKNVVLINKKNQQYKQEIDMKIKDIENFVEQNIQAEINDTFGGFTNEIQRLIKEVVQTERNLESNREVLEQRRQELVNKAKQGGIAGIFKIIGHVINFFGPVATIVTGVISAITQKSEENSPVASIVGTILEKLPDIMHGIKKASNYAENINNYNTLNRRMSDFRADLDKLASDAERKLDEEMAEEIIDLIDQTKQELKTITQDNSAESQGVSAFNKIKKGFKQKLNEKQKELNIDLSQWTSVQTIYSKTVEYISAASEIAEMSFNLFNNRRSDSKEIEKITQAIEETNTNILELKKYNDKIQTVFIPMVNNIENSITNLQEKIQTQKQFQLDISKWEITRKLRQLKTFIKNFIQFNLSDIPQNMINIAEQYEAIIDLHINLFKQIENYQEHKQFADYVAELNSHGSKHDDINDPKLKKALDKLSYQIQCNIILDQHRKTMKNFYQWVFPFAKILTPDTHLPSIFTYNKNTVSLLQVTVTEQLELLKRKLDEYKYTIFQRMDQHIHQGIFSHKYKSTKPFYTWDNDHYNSQIGKLLSGHEIALYANIKNSNPRKNAIKFRQIQLDFTVRDTHMNTTVWHELQNLLQHFEITLTHMGNSHYRCNDKFYVIYSSSQKIIYSYERRDDGQPIRSNRVYSKLKNGDLLLSPYALWKIKLTPTSDNITFDQLEQFKHFINLDLAGFGYYIQSDSTICTNLDDYYDEMDTESEQQIVSELISRQVARELAKNHNEDDDAITKMRKRDVHPTVDNKYRYLTEHTVSAGNLPTSPINNLLKWATGTWQQLSATVSEIFDQNIFGTTNPFTKLLLSDSSSSNNYSPSNLHISSDFNSTLLLTNYAIRLFTREKFENFLFENNALWLNEAQMLAINLTEKLENSIIRNNENDEDPIDFDGVDMQKKIFKLLINKNFQGIEKLFIHTIKK